MEFFSNGATCAAAHGANVQRTDVAVDTVGVVETAAVARWTGSRRVFCRRCSLALEARMTACIGV